MQITMAMRTIQFDFFEQYFLEDLPNKPYCTDELGVTYIRSKNTAVNKRYLQINQPKMIIYLVFDVDYEGGAIAWYDCGLPPPLWTSKNPKNGHAHIVYRLEIPVCTSDIARIDPLRYVAAIQSAFCEKLNADIGYSGLLTKNPLHSDWETYNWTKRTYTLDELAGYVDLKGHPKRRGIEATGLGRNVELFDTTRKWAYKAIREFWQPDYKAKWFDAVLSHVEGLNGQFSAPLPHSEVKSISKSIAKWTNKHFTPAGFSEEQAKRGRKSKGGGRPTESNSERTLKPWEELNVSRRTYYRWKKANKI